MPSGIHGSFAGTAAVFQASLSTQPLLILAALIAVYIVLGMLYESLIHPLTILSTLPSAGLGALLALLVTGNELSLVSTIGIILLIGIVKKNAIMMVDFALDAERHEGLSPEESIYQACLVRFRPIMMTTMAAMFGAVPLAIGMGVGSELRQPLGIAIVGGLIVSQCSPFTPRRSFISRSIACGYAKRSSRKQRRPEQIGLPLRPPRLSDEAAYPGKSSRTNTSNLFCGCRGNHRRARLIEESSFAPEGGIGVVGAGADDWQRCTWDAIRAANYIACAPGPSEWLRSGPSLFTTDGALYSPAAFGGAVA